MDYVKIDGLEEVIKLFNDLPPKLEKKALKPALREVAKLVQREAKNNLARHRRTGLLMSSVKVVSLRDKPGYPVAVIVGVPRKSKILDVIAKERPGFKPSWKPYYWRYLEYGYTRKGRHYPAQPWLRPAMQAASASAGKLLRQYAESYFSSIRGGVA